MKYYNSVFSLLLFIGLTVIGCGYNPEKPVYDTKSNPQNYPLKACQLIEKFENDKIGNTDEATIAFTDLYSTHPDLLDNSQWAEIINRLGTKLRVKGDSLTSLGISSYIKAGQYYNIAAITNPKDVKTQEKAGLFQTWQNAQKLGILDNIDLSGKAENKISRDLIDIIRHFAFGDSLHQEFCNQYLKTSFKEIFHQEKDACFAMLPSLSLNEKLLLSSLELIKTTPDKRLAVFTSPGIELLSFEIIKSKSNKYQIVFFITPVAEIHDPFTFSIRIPFEEKSMTDEIFSRGYRHFDLKPFNPDKVWQPGHVYYSALTFHLDGYFDYIKLGIYMGDNEETGVYAQPEGIPDKLVRLEFDI